MKAPIVPARLDSDRSAKPLTKLTKHFPADGKCVGPESTPLYMTLENVTTGDTYTIAPAQEKYVVHGSCMEYMAVLHTLASSEAEAKAKWEKAFTAEQRGGMFAEVWKAAEIADSVWVYDGYTYYSGGYHYDL